MLWWTLRQLKANDREKRIAAILKLGDARETRATQAIVEVLQNDWDRDICLAAIEALGKIKDLGAVAPLINLLGDKSGDYRFAAAKALDEIGWQPKDDEQRGLYAVACKDWEQATRIGAAAVNPLLLALKDNDSNSRQAAIQSLGKIGDSRAIEPLFALRKDKAVCKDAVKALGGIKENRAIERLVTLLVDEKQELRAAASLALQQADPDWMKSEGAKRAMPSLVEALKDSDDNIRIAAVTTMGKISDARAINLLIGMLVDGNQEVREAASLALQQADPNWMKSDGAKVAVPSLAKALKDNDDELRITAVTTLRMIGQDLRKVWCEFFTRSI